MSGEGGKVFIVPSLDLVIVRMGHEGGQEIGLKDLNLALRDLSAVFERTNSNSASPHQSASSPRRRTLSFFWW
jgi:hypothetical protein